MSASRPIIGVTSYLEQATMGVWDVPAVFLPTSYVKPIAAAGASIVVLPPQEVNPEAVSRILNGLDGLCVSGGYDVDPAAYGHSPHPQTDAPRNDRDAWEFALLAAALEADMPVLGVCRGAQVLNVLRGGTLHQHLPDVVGSPRHQGENGVFAKVPVRVIEGTLLATLHPLSREVPVYHHQAIDALGAGLVVSAWSDDGVIEAVEDPSLTFCIAAQWHPEQDPGGARLYQGFVQAARAYRA
ncbi:gamma-glutamyl-gamma-aminobutyrate hydrolase family protein [Demequina lutea]|uniref:Putative glutamine amidotransferase n=1 Tax=Demequina lutea TaxID=431489 RepID=A0A7Y9Z9V2_9MICO|nr:gamma-glutamyl-gamma-aminobutyrate hydrolase family protein [Demequina lutea]NYI41442.1 putative glutamine amidotransferase [Demequina lutea]